MSNLLFSPAQLGSITLTNRIAMAPMTRSRAYDNLPNDLIAKYYAQRASAGLIITEGVAPSPNGLGYARIPGLFSAEQIAGWKTVTQAIHEKGGHAFVQLMHTGRIGHPLNLPAGAEVVAPSAIPAKGPMWTDQEGLKENAVPREMSTADVKQAIQEFVQAAKNAVEAGFDGVELHSANGYLLDQFLNPHSNQRTDEYGGTVENRTRFLLEIAEQTAQAIGKERVGVRFSPYNVFNDMAVYPEIPETYTYLAEKLNDLGIAYLHLIDTAAPDGAETTRPLIKTIREKFSNTLILNNKYTVDRAEEDLQSGLADLIAFGAPFIANPDLVERLSTGAELAQFDAATLYAGGEKGFADYPALAEATA
ncbi:N-ethylmaleimide reductase [Larkinella arboricola]|uniref:N-ethylmaleimide reductase n=1 Tax=Larkinella arboricola TaxID=643671 RepID=A0A327X8Q8_LARAB|nr:alkene reductase [Larkinella arboricola]RAK02628.1 N-ethylmaleimide reductase [Larkinella arboricola]